MKKLAVVALAALAGYFILASVLAAYVATWGGEALKSLVPVFGG